MVTGRLNPTYSSALPVFAGKKSGPRFGREGPEIALKECLGALTNTLDKVGPLVHSQAMRPSERRAWS